MADRWRAHPAQYGADPTPLAIAHRGGAGLGPENTLATFARASALGVRYLETDLQVTADGVAVCLHDPDLDRTLGIRRPAASLDLADLRAVSVRGSAGVAGRIPTFDEALDAEPQRCFTVDLKDRRASASLVRSLRRPGVAERVCVAGAWDGCLADLRREVPAVSVALGWRSLGALLGFARAGITPPRRVATGGFAHVPLRLGATPVLTERVVAMAHSIGVRVVVWTVDDPALIRALLDTGVDGIITDRPDVLRDELIARGEWTAMPGRAGGLASDDDLARVEDAVRVERAADRPVHL